MTCLPTKRPSRSKRTLSCQVARREGRRRGDSIKVLSNCTMTNGRQTVWPHDPWTVHNRLWTCGFRLCLPSVGPPSRPTGQAATSTMNLSMHLGLSLSAVSVSGGGGADKEATCARRRCKARACVAMCYDLLQSTALVEVRGVSFGAWLRHEQRLISLKIGHCWVWTERSRNLA